MCIYLPYVYLIGWVLLDIWYIGSETANRTKIANPDNLWTTYFTSSDYVKAFRKEYGEPDHISIYATFDTQAGALFYEKYLIRATGAVRSPHFLNRHEPGEKFVCIGPMSEDSIRKNREGHLGTTHSEATKQKHREARLGYRHSEETLTRMRHKHKKDSRKRRSKGPVACKKISEKTKIRAENGELASQRRVSCIHCRKEVNVAVLARCHGDKCKSYLKQLSQ